MADCRLARDTIARWSLDESAVAEHDLARAHAHIAGCAACRNELARFSRSILSSDPDEVTCAEVRARFDDAAAGAGPATAAIHAHLERCPECSAEVATWQRVLALTEQGALATPARYPVFDLSFLPQPVDVWQQVRSTVRRLSYEIPAALALVGQTLASPPPSLAVSYAGVEAARRGARHKGKESLVTLSVDDQQQDVRISLDVTEAEKALWLAVSMRLASSGQVIGGARVALCNDKGQPQEIKTVRSSEVEVRFPDIAPGHYVVRIESSGKTWELPVSL